MAKQRFLNNFTTTFIAAVKDAPSSGTPETELDYGVLRISDGAAGSLINPTDGDYYLLTAFKRSGSVESNIEVMRVTGVNNATPGECRITVQRAQEGTSAKAFVAGDYLSLRITKGTAENFSQPADLATKEPVIAAPGSAPTEKYWRGDKTWSDFFTDVRAATLTGLSTATNAVVAATDTVLAAIGKLQAQVSAKFDKTGGDVDGNINLAGTGRRITGDFSNATVTARLVFKTNVPNSQTAVEYCPSGSGNTASVHLRNYDIDAGGVGNLLQLICTNSAYVGPTPIGGAAPIPLVLRANGDRLTIDPTTGNILSMGGAIGYGVGTGGTAQQPTSITSNVILNKPNGVITLANGSITGSGIIVFQLENTFITENSIVVVHGIFTGTGTGIAQFTPQVIYVQTGVAFIQIKNNNAGSVSTDGVTLRFAVFAGSAS